MGVDVCIPTCFTVKQHVELHEDLKNKFIKGAKEQKELYNKVLELKGTESVLKNNTVKKKIVLAN